MNFLTFFVTVMTFLTSTNADETLQAHVAFKRLGLYASGVTRGHLHLPLDLQAVRDAVGSLIPEINAFKSLLTASDGGPGKERSKSAVLMVTLQETLTELDSTFQRYCTMTNLEPIMPTGYSRADLSSLLQSMKSLETHSRQRKELGSLLNHRGKRQVEFVSLGLSLYNFYELMQLSRQIDSQQKDIEVLKHTVEHTALVTNQLVDTVNSYKTVLNRFAERLNNGLYELYRIEVYLQLNAHLQKMINEINLLVNGLGDLFQGKLNPVILNWPKVESAMYELSQRADKKKLRPIFSEWGWVLNAPFSFFISNGILKLYVHIPFYADNLYPLFKYLDLPMVSKEYKNNGLALIVDPSEEYLAIDPKLHIGKAMNKGDFESCKSYQLRDEKVFVCDDSAITETHLDETCIGLLFTGIFKWDDLEKVCDLKLSFPKATYHVIDSNKLAYFLPTETETRLDCENVSRIIVEKKVGLNVQEVPNNCRFTAPHISFVPETNLNANTEPWVMFPREIPFAHITFDWHAAEKFLNDINGLHRLTKVSLDEFRHHRWTSDFGKSHLATTLFVIACLVCAGCVVAYLAWRRGMCERVKKEEKKSENDIELGELKSVRPRSNSDAFLRFRKE